MKRRKFIEYLLKALGVSVLPIPILDIILETPENNLIADDWIIDPIAKEIRYVGKVNNNGITMQELYNFLREEWQTNDYN